MSAELETKLEELVKLVTDTSVILRDCLDGKTFDSRPNFKLELVDFYRTFGPLLLNATYFHRRIKEHANSDAQVR